jgi:hypothetical protein
MRQSPFGLVIAHPAAFDGRIVLRQPNYTPPQQTVDTTTVRTKFADAIGWDNPTIACQSLANQPPARNANNESPTCIYDTSLVAHSSSSRRVFSNGKVKRSLASRISIHNKHMCRNCCRDWGEIPGAMVLHARSIFQPGTVSRIDDSSERQARLVCARRELSSILLSNSVKRGVSGNVRSWMGSGSKI